MAIEGGRRGERGGGHVACKRDTNNNKRNMLKINQKRKMDKFSDKTIKF